MQLSSETDRNIMIGQISSQCKSNARFSVGFLASAIPYLFRMVFIDSN